MHFGQTLANSGIFEEAVQMSEKGMRLHPHRPLYYYVMTIESYYRAGRYEECLAMAEQVIEPSRKAGYWGGVAFSYIWSAMAHLKLGQESEARKDVAEALKIFPWYSLEYERSMSLVKPAMLQQDLDDLRKAGVPEHPPSQ
jgi:tetratricopeptide (TPR) repeat protein